MEKFTLRDVELWYNDFKVLKSVTMDIGANEIMGRPAAESRPCLNA